MARVFLPIQDLNELVCVQNNNLGLRKEDQDKKVMIKNTTVNVAKLVILSP